ncbi:RecQ family helicase MusN [Penicillium manginii]|uniref:RecQ family helicase MusN n=1 Tax=Penicillium manginii TaxID=203109 RepID=UPI002546D0A6|nr:RecQ family helicase MusN [Penicillium manginii]KAJ5743473.1 RecQ family helicase MusN [Penicillium manginii]
MARLMLTPSAERRPRMLSHSVKKPDRTPSTSKRPSCLRSMNPTWKRRQYFLNQISHRFGGRKLITPPFDTVGSIDLTGAIGPLTSASSITDSGEQHPSWTEDAATRKDPHEERGTKRKSEEYTSGSTEIRRPWKANSPPTLGKTSAELLAESNRTSRTAPLNVAERPRRNSPNPPQNRDEEGKYDWFDVENIENMFVNVEPEFCPQPSPMCGVDKEKERQHQTAAMRYHNQLEMKWKLLRKKHSLYSWCPVLKNMIRKF